MSQSQLRERLKSFGEDTVWAVFQDLSLVIVGFGSFALVISALSEASYGAYLGAFGVVAPLTGLAWNGLALVVLQKILRDLDDPAEVLRISLRLTALVGLGSGLLAFVLTDLLIPTLSITEIVLLISAEVLGAAFVGICASLAQAALGFPFGARIRIGLLAIKLTVVGGLFVADSLTIASLGAGLTIGYVSYVLYLLGFHLPKRGISPGWQRAKPGYWKAASAFSGPILVGSLQTDGDKTALNAYGYPEVAGTYGASFKLVTFAMMPINAIEAAAFQRFLSHDETARGQHIRRARLSAYITLPLAFMAMAVLYVGAPQVPVIFGSKFGDSPEMIRWLLLYMPIYALTTAPLNALLGLGKMYQRAAIYLGGAVVSVGCYITLIPSMTWRGGLIGTLAGEATIAVLGWASLVRFQRDHDRTLDEPGSTGGDDFGEPSDTDRLLEFDNQVTFTRAKSN